MAEWTSTRATITLAGVFVPPTDSRIADIDSDTWPMTAQKL
jgi:hypothetical protein